MINLQQSATWEVDVRWTRWSQSHVVPGRCLWSWWALSPAGGLAVVVVALLIIHGMWVAGVSAQTGQGGDGTAAAQSATPAEPTESMEQATTRDADMSDQQARSHFRLGRQYYDQGQFVEAAQEFEIAHGLSGRDELLFNVYLAHRDAQNVRKAAGALRGYLAAVPTAADREHLTARLAALDAQLKQDDAETERQRRQAAEAERRRQTAEREREAAQQLAREAEARAALRPSRPWWPWLVVGSGLAAVGTGLALGMLADADADELRKACVADPRTDGAIAPLVMGPHCAPSVDLESERSSIQSQAMVSDALWIGGSVVAVTGLILVFALPDEYPDGIPVALGCAPGQCRADVRVRF